LPDPSPPATPPPSTPRHVRAGIPFWIPAGMLIAGVFGSPWPAAMPAGWGGPSGPGLLAAQQIPADGWNSPRALALRELGREARQGLVDDGTLQSYRALTEGHIYFYVDPEEGERALIRVDQVAVELHWEAPDLVRQRIVGERTETRLPVRDFRYYLDRLTLVQYGFGDEIQVGQGMDVADVPHPLAPARRNAAGEPFETYDVRVADSVALRLPGEAEPLRILELQVRPRDPARPGVLGSIFVNAADGQLVRMAFTFTPASYVDPRTDRIQVDLDYGLWEGRYWLPNRQEIEVRREVPELDFGIGTVIRAVLRVGDYELNVPLPDFLRVAPAVTQAPPADRDAYAFREGLFDALDRDGMTGVATRVDPRELRAEAARLLRNRPPTGLSPIRFHLPDASSLVRADRVRGVTVGAGTSIRPSGALRMRGWAGYSFASERPSLSLDLDGPAGDAWTFRVDGLWAGQGDLGARPGAPGLLGTASALLLGEDYLDPYRVDRVGGRLGTLTPAGTRFFVDAGLERHRSERQRWTEAPWDGAKAFRAVRPVDDGTWGALRSGLARRVEGLGWEGWGGPLGAILSLEGTVELLAGQRTWMALDPDWTGGLRIEGQASLLRRPPDGRHEFRAGIAGGARLTGTIEQQARYLGGAGTVPGFPYRSIGGGRWLMASTSAATDLGSPWIRLRGGLDGGWAGDVGPYDVLLSLPPGARPLVPSESGPIVGARLGVGLVYDILRLELARGLSGPGAEWQFIVGIDPLWWNRL
jgi:hypothetical protein